MKRKCSDCSQRLGKHERLSSWHRCPLCTVSYVCGTCFLAEEGGGHAQTCDGFSARVSAILDAPRDEAQTKK
ncbi:MAG: hypothetical protein Marn2KO_36950 [Marinobacter nauticus]